MIKIIVVITARASYSRIKSVMRSFLKSQKVDLQIIITASSLVDDYGAIEKYLIEDGFKTSYKIFSQLNTQDISFQVKTTALSMIELSNYFTNFQPNAVITIADRFETIGTAISASYLNIPLIHIQGGEVSGNIDNKVRDSITFLSDFHFVSNKNALKKLISMGVSPKSIFDLGCPSIDLAKEIEELKINDEIYSKYSWSGEKVNLKNPYLVVLQHSVTNEPNSKLQIEETIKAINELNLPTIWFWPNVDSGTDGISKGLRIFKNKRKTFPVTFFKSLDPQDFLKLINHSTSLIGNSSVGIRESSYLGVPVVNIGNRQKNRLRGKNIVDVSYKADEIIEAVKGQLSKKYDKDLIYGNGNSGERIVNKIIEIFESET